jgi:hypothetical protein
LGGQGQGLILMSGPKTTAAGPFKSWEEINSWNPLDNGVPVTFDQELDDVGYYKFQWQCKANDGTVGAFVDVIVHVVATPSELPEAPPIAAIAACFIALGAFAAASKKIKIPI